MNEAEFLDRVRSAMARRKPKTSRDRDEPGSSERHEGRLIPGRAVKPHEELVADFMARLAAQAVMVREVASGREVPAAVAAALATLAATPKIRHGADAVLLALPWDTVPALARQTGPAQPDDVATMSVAVAGIAETGTLVLASGADNPASLAFLPTIHIVAVAREAIVGAIESAFDLVTAVSAQRALPRALNLVSGASRTGDIGGRLVHGAHGPRHLVVIVVGNDKGATPAP